MWLLSSRRKRCMSSQLGTLQAFPLGLITRCDIMCYINKIELEQEQLGQISAQKGKKKNFFDCHYAA